MVKERPPTETGSVLHVLAQVPDPEIPVVSVVDLGIVRGLVREGGGQLAVLVTPTYTGCPASAVIASTIRAALDEAGHEDVAIRTVLSPPWSTDMITEAGREKLRTYGIVPPSVAGDDRPAPCPRCGSARTREVSRFGSTPCKALWQCHDCHEPFDRFKCL